MQTLECPNCKIEENLFNLNNREDATIMIYREGKPKIRDKDGLHIYSLICFKCNTITEWGADPLNESGKAVKGVEYIKTKKISKKDKIEAINYAEENNHNHLINKLNG
jgi:hypothetical protein